MALNTQTYFGTDGELVLISEQAPIAALFDESGRVARVTNVFIYINTKINPFHEIGTRLPSELRAGNIYISGTVERAYINGALLKLMLAQYATEVEGKEIFPIPSFNMNMNLNNLAEDGASGLTVYDVMFDSWQVNLPEDDFMLEKLSFKAKRIAVNEPTE